MTNMGSYLALRTVLFSPLSKTFLGEGRCNLVSITNEGKRTRTRRKAGRAAARGAKEGVCEDTEQEYDTGNRRQRDGGDVDHRVDACMRVSCCGTYMYLGSSTGCIVSILCGRA